MEKYRVVYLDCKYSIEISVRSLGVLKFNSQGNSVISLYLIVASCHLLVYLVAMPRTLPWLKNGASSNRPDRARLDPATAAKRQRPVDSSSDKDASPLPTNVNVKRAALSRAGIH